MATDRHARISILLAAALGAIPACTRQNPIYCETASQCTDPDRLFCDLGGQYGPANTCIALPGVDAAADAMLCTTSPSCTSSATPICASGLCRGCISDPECVARGGTTLRCSPATQGCVECLQNGDCPAARPVCAQSQCQPCHLPVDCGSSVCDVAGGACVPEIDVAYVSSSGCPITGMGTRGNPYCHIQTAIDQATATIRFIHIAGGIYPEALSVVGKTVVLVGEGTVSVRPPSNSAALSESGDADVRAEGLTFEMATGANGNGVRCNDASTNHPKLTLSGCRIQGNAGQGLYATQCVLLMDATWVLTNTGGGVHVESTDFTIENSVLANNGATLNSNFGGLDINGTGPAGTHGLQNDTIAYNTAPVGSYSMICVPAMEALNTIVWGNVGGTINGCSFRYSDVQGGVAGTGNFATDPHFVNMNSYDFHLQSDSSCKDTGLTPGAPMHDIDGDPRPLGMSADVGADEIRP